MRIFYTHFIFTAVQLTLATNNRHKRNEIENALHGLNVTCVTQSELGVAPVAETGHSFTDNALIKAQHLFEAHKGHVLADDSGIVVPSLGGAPGVRSARYAGEHVTDAENNQKLLDELAATKDAQRDAYFVCVLVFLCLDAQEQAHIYNLEEHWHGTIALCASGKKGFGYDSIFIPSGMDKTAAHLDMKTKNSVSHRGKALTRLHTILIQHLQG